MNIILVSGKLAKGKTVALPVFPAVAGDGLLRPLFHADTYPGYGNMIKMDHGNG
jgi:hypothetical protein